MTTVMTMIMNNIQQVKNTWVFEKKVLKDLVRQEQMIKQEMENNNDISMCILARWGPKQEWDEIVDLQDIPMYVDEIELVVYCRG